MLLSTGPPDDIRPPVYCLHYSNLFTGPADDIRPPVYQPRSPSSSQGLRAGLPRTTLHQGQLQGDVPEHGLQVQRLDAQDDTPLLPAHGQTSELFVGVA